MVNCCSSKHPEEARRGGEERERETRLVTGYRQKQKNLYISTSWNLQLSRSNGITIDDKVITYICQLLYSSFKKSPHPLLMCSPLSRTPSLTVSHLLQSTPLLTTNKHTSTHTLTHFQNKTRLFTKPENPEWNPIFAFQRVFEVPAQMLLSSFFYYFYFMQESFPLLFSPPCSAQCDTLSVSVNLPRPSIFSSMITGWKFYPEEKYVLKSCWVSLSSREGKGIRG